MIKYFVRTTNERILDESFSQINYELIVDTKHQPVISFIDSLEYISDYDSILLEDDVILCNDFKERIEQVISDYPNDIINFFTLPMTYFTTHITDDFFKFNQCTYYPKGISKVIAEKMKNHLYENIPYGYDTIEGWSFKEMNLSYLVYRPCLVQHIDYKSLISKSHHRRSPYFIDYLEALGIKYEDAKLSTNKTKLLNYMNEKFKDIDKN